ncbi:2-oxo acid dehydrogenase subunit E2 [Paraburkholderia lycopersici]|uniref:Dihydrolipoamide acetyltransferase component of pyruvate dehydrogenase complex n=1 Tax=Paraburkholderia lycopersici TaxID=416944 RepID=A0A1G7D8S9_9BURK|nr:2-oxo acid dehydrogenase subunit E2 [Paraburkholderia lycopersici]SDE47175.1 pyruvate dehydrogenase E2 component (dihydrolipoamide acetyltransferase) [Paraburkholderia lycopersici]
MKRPITMPALSDTMSNGTLVRWLKQAGDPVKSGEVIAEVETDKAIMEVEAFHDGILAGPLADANREYPVGQVIGYIDHKAVLTASERTPEAAVAPPVVLPPQAQPMPPPASAVMAAKGSQAESPPPPVIEAQPSSSAVFAAAAAARIQPAHVARSGSDVAPGSSERDLEARAAPIATPAPPAQTPPLTPTDPARHLPGLDLDAGPPYRIVPAPGLRAAVARNMAASTATPTFHVTASMPFGPLMRTAEEHKTSLTLLLVCACAKTIATHPVFNSTYTPVGLAQRERIDIGIAIDGPDGLVAPVLRDVAMRTHGELANDWSALRDKALSRRLALADYRGATFYISDLGTFAIVHAFDSIVPQGAAAILSVAAARDGEAFVTLSCDHRVVFGADAARFLQTLQGWLADPQKLL